MNFAKIKVVDINGEIIFHDASLHLPISEEYIIQRSIELFKDPEPCVIHRSAVLFHICNELTNLLKGKSTIEGDISVIKWESVKTQISSKLVFDKEPEIIIAEFC